MTCTPGPSPTLAPSAGRSLGGLLIAMAIAHTGTRVSAIAFPWFVLSTTGSAAATGLVALFELAPYVVVKALAGPWVDRVGGRRVSWSTDLLSAAAAGAIPLLHVAGHLSFGGFLLLVAVVGAARGPGDLAREIMVPEAAERTGVPLVRATGLSSTIERLASTVGPAVGGILIAAIGPLAGVGVNALCFLLGSVVVALVLPQGMGGRAPEEPNDPQGDDSPAGYLHRLAEGATFLRRDALLATIIVMVGITNLLDVGFSTVLLPVWAHDTGRGAGTIGLLLTVMSAGAVVGAIIASATAHRLRRRPVFLIGFLIAGAPRYLILVADVETTVVVAVFAAAGLGSGFLNPILGAVLFERVPRRLYGRVGALADAASWAGMPVGGLCAGLLIAAAGLGPALLTAGIVYLLTTSLAGLRPEWREMDRRPAGQRLGDHDGAGDSPGLGESAGLGDGAGLGEGAEAPARLMTEASPVGRADDPGRTG